MGNIVFLIFKGQWPINSSAGTWISMPKKCCILFFSQVSVVQIVLSTSVSKEERQKLESSWRHWSGQVPFCSMYFHACALLFWPLKLYRFRTGTPIAPVILTLADILSNVLVQVIQHNCTDEQLLAWLSYWRNHAAWGKRPAGQLLKVRGPLHVCSCPWRSWDSWWIPNLLSGLWRWVKTLLSTQLCMLKILQQSSHCARETMRLCIYVSGHVISSL